MSKKCNACGAQVDNQAAFCQACGSADLIENEVTPNLIYDILILKYYSGVIFDEELTEEEIDAFIEIRINASEIHDIINESAIEEAKLDTISRRDESERKKLLAELNLSELNVKKLEQLLNDQNVKIEKPNKALEVQGELVPGEPIDFKVSLDQLDLKFSQLEQIEKAEMVITDVNTKETEKVTFERRGGLLTASVPSKEVEHSFHWDILALIAIFALTMLLSQKLMMAQNKNASNDPTQEAIQKSMGTFMPIMIIMTFVIIPIPAGVLIYLIMSNIFQVAQTIIVNKQIDMEEAAKKIHATDGGKVIEAEIVDEKQPKVNGSLLDILKEKFGGK